MEKILLIDDDQVHTLTLGGILRKEGYEVATAHDSETGLIRSRELKPDVILLDIGLPGMSGYEVCRRIKADPQTKDITVIMVTGRDTGDAFEAAIDKGADSYIVKPYSMEHLFKVIRRSVKSRSGL